MPKLKMYRGLPGSGKTTQARAEVVTSGNAGHVNRDDLRAMLFDSVWTGRREGVVVDCAGSGLTDHSDGTVSCDICDGYGECWVDEQDAPPEIRTHKEKR